MLPSQTCRYAESAQKELRGLLQVSFDIDFPASGEPDDFPAVAPAAR
jgi:hypothetical protein